MAITKEQLVELGFKPSKRGGGLSANKKYDTLVYPIDNTDFLYIGYNQFNKQVNNKKIWKSFKTSDGSRFTYCVISLGETGYNELKSYLRNAKESIQYKSISNKLTNNTLFIAGVDPYETVDDMIPFINDINDN